MTYYYAKTFRRPFDEIVAATRDALGQEGFDVITEIDVRQTMRAKLDVEVRPYLILGACNPRLTYEALQLENKIGTMLPCNVIIQDVGDGTIEVAAIDPVASMQAISNDELTSKASGVGEKLRAAIDQLNR